MSFLGKALGRQGENAAETFLKERGYTIAERNYKNPLGEIDLVAWHKGTLVFVEVKTRSHEDLFGTPAEAVNRRKQKKIVQVALVYIKAKRVKDIPIRFDVLAVSPQRIQLIPNAFPADFGYTY